MSTATNVSTTIGGFVTPPAGIVNCRLGVVAYEGDFGLNGDSFQLNGTSLSDGLSPATNFFNSSITRFGAAVTTKNPNYTNQLGFDADLLSVSGALANGASSATLSLTSTQDEYYPAVLTFATDLYAPVFDDANLTKTVVDLNGSPVRPGDILEYTLTMKNVGQDHATQCVLRDTLATTLTYVAGSLQVLTGPNAGAKTDVAADDQMEYVAASRSVVARLGTGATGAAGGQINVSTSTSVKFRAQVTPPVPTGTLVSNQGALAFVAQQSGVAFNARSDGDATTGGTQPTVVSTVSAAITGTVFEDVNYGGGVARTRAAAAGAPCVGARVELYDASGNFKIATTTNAAGLYTLDGWTPGLYTVRVVNASVLSTRPGAVASLIPVQTYRTDATSGAAVSVADRVGGETPSRADAAANTTNATLASLTTATTTAQSVSPVTLANSNITGMDFGFSFDTIVNVNDAGQGSLRQFITNANALTNATLAQSGLTSGVETSVFMVSDGAAHAGLRAGLTNLLTAGVALITSATALPALTDPSTRIDGATQTANVGDTNPALVGSAASVGVDALSTAAVSGPEVELRGTSGVGVGLDLQANDLAVANLALLSFGTAVASDASASIRVGAAALRPLIDRCVLGSTAQSFTVPAAALRTRGDQVRVLGGDNGIVRDCVIGFAAGSGIAMTAGSNGWAIDGCTLLGNASGNATLGQVVVASSGTLAMTRCLVTGGDGPGVDAITGTGGITLDNLTVRQNGRGSAPVSGGVRAGGSGGTASRCIVQDNFGAGVQVASTGSAWTLTRNSMSGNGNVTPNAGGAVSGQIGIDLQSAADNAATGTSPYVTRNDNGDGDAGGNALLNFPVLESAVLSNGSFTVAGWARPGSTIELFVSDGDASGFGEGVTYVATVTEGTASDLDAGASAYASPVNGLNQGADNTNRFRFTLPLPAGVAVGTRLTATATIAATGTSEFSGIVSVTTGVSVSGFAYADADHDTHEGRQRDRHRADVVCQARGRGRIVRVAGRRGDAGHRRVHVHVRGRRARGPWCWTTPTNPADITPGVPSGWLRTENATGTLVASVNSTNVGNENFGLFAGSRASGLLFRDDGVGGGLANNGARDGSEAALSNQRVRLTSGVCAGGVCDSTLTDGAGAFDLWLPTSAAGVVSVRATSPAGWFATGGSAGTSPGTYLRASDAVTFTATPGIAYSGLAFGHVPPACAPRPVRSPWRRHRGVQPRHRHREQRGHGQRHQQHRTRGGRPAAGTTLARPELQPVRRLHGEPGLPAAVALAHRPGVAGTAKVQARRSVRPAGSRVTATLTASFSYDNASPALGDARALDDVTTITFANGLVIRNRSTAPPRRRAGSSSTPSPTRTPAPCRSRTSSSTTPHRRGRFSIRPHARRSAPASPAVR